MVIRKEDIMDDFGRSLWIKAQQIAKEEYEENYGDWEEADTYEREDHVFTAYEKLVEEEKMKQMRDEKGRFISNKVNNVNNTSNMKGNDNMNNSKMTNKEMRMETLKQNGINVDNFFDLSMRIPFGAEVKIMVDGKEMIVGQPTYDNGKGYGFNLTGVDEEKIKKYGAMISNVLTDDEIAQNIIENGYVKNSKLFRRWITAHTFRMLNYKAWRDPSRTGWEACMKDCYDYNYQFSMLLEEIRVLSILQKEDKEAFEERIHFFNGDVVVATLKDYQKRLRKYIDKQRVEKPRTYRNQPYVKLARYGNVLVKDLFTKVYIPIVKEIEAMEYTVKTGDYTCIYKALKHFMDNYYNKLPHDTTKCAKWKDAFKASGAYYTLLNLIRFHNVIIEDCGNKYYSERFLKDLLDGAYKNEVWRFHQLLVDTIKYNNFDLKTSIRQGNAAPNTHSDIANGYRRRA